MRIEPATADDVDAVVDQWVDLAHEQRAHDTHILPEANRERIRETFLRRVLTEELLVARGSEAGGDGGEAGGDGEEDAILGFVAFGTETGSFEDDVDRGVVSNLFVRPDRRGEGIGAELLGAAERSLRDSGASVVALEAMADNEAARRFYRRHGYEPHRIEFEKDL